MATTINSFADQKFASASGNTSKSQYPPLNPNMLGSLATPLKFPPFLSSDTRPKKTDCRFLSRFGNFLVF